MARRREIRGFDDVIARVLRRADPAGKRHGAQAVVAWDSVVGPEIARHTRGFALRENGQLVVYVDSAAWANQLSLMSDELAEQLNSHLGQTTVRAIRFTASRTVSDRVKWEATEDDTDVFYRPDDVEPLPLDGTEVEQARHVAAAIRDQRLRAVALRVMIKDLERKKGQRSRAAEEHEERS
jgi:hypothetical protein